MAFEDDEVRARRESLLEVLDNSHDLEKRIAALNTLVEQVNSPHEHDAVVAPVARALKAAQQPLSLAALTSLPLLLSSATWLPHHLSRALNAWLPHALERCGDQKERVKQVAREAVLALGKNAVESQAAGAAHAAATGKTAKEEAPLAMFERLIREGGLTAKSPRVREQVTHLLPALRTAAPRLPLRPLLPALVDLLSDADGPVREAARTACIALFSNAPAAAKSDLKKELERKAVRKQTADALIAAVFSGAAAASADLASSKGAGGSASVPDSVANAAASAAAGPLANALANAPDHALPPPATTPASEEGVDPVYIATRMDLERTFAAMLPSFEGKETEHNWGAREQACIKIRGMLRTGVHEQMTRDFAASVHKVCEGLIKAILSLRTTLAMHGITLISELAVALGEELHESVEMLLVALLKMAGFTKKLVAAASQKAVDDIIRHTHYRHKFLDLIWSYVQEKTVSTRLYMCGHMLVLLDVHGRAHKHALESHDGVAIVDKFLKRALPDQNKDVRATARDAFARFQTIWPTEAAALLETLEPATRKQIAAASATSGTSTPTSAGSAAKPRTMSGAAVRKPGGPSSALLAAKRAASERLAKEKREAEEYLAAAAAEEKAAADEEAARSNEATPVATPRAGRPPSVIVSPKPTGIPLPSTPRSRQTPHSRSTSASSSAQGQPTPRVPSNAATPRNAAPQRDRASSNGSHASGVGRLGSAATPRNGSSAPQASSSRSRTASVASSSAPSSRVDAAMLNQDPDDTARLEDLEDASVDLMAFSSPLKMPSKFRPASKLSVEERVRQEAQQAESSAQHLLDLMEDPATPKKELPAPVTPTPLSAVTTSPQTKRSSLPRPVSVKPALAETQPAAASKSAVPSTPGGKPIPAAGTRAGAAWFLKRANRLENVASSPIKAKPEAPEWVEELANGTADLRTFRRLAKLSSEFKVPLVMPATPLDERDQGESMLQAGPAAATMGSLGLEKMRLEQSEGREYAIEAWQEGHLFDKLWTALMAHLDKPAKSEEIKSAGLVVLQRLVENQLSLIASTGKESELLTLLFGLRKQRERYTLNACEALIDAWTSRTEPILGLGTLTSALGAALGDPSTLQAGESARVRVYTLGLRSLGQILLRLPPELVEEELPRAKTLVKDAYNDANVDLRLAAVQVIIAAHQRLKDTAVLFGLLAPLEPSQLDLLSYYLAKASA